MPTITGVILAAGLFAPSEARGECGDYIVYTNPAHAKPMGEHSPGPAKCQGPNCSQAPAPAPMPQAPPTLRILPDQTLPLVGGDPSNALDTFSYPFDPTGGSPVHRASDVYHPPR